MSVAHFSAQQKRDAASMDPMQGVARVGLVVNFNPESFTAQVTFQPSGVQSGWLPVLSQWVGAGWGMVPWLQQNDQVLVVMESGESGHGVIVGRYFNAVDPPPQVGAAGEFWLQHVSGAKFGLQHDGTIQLNAAAGVVVTGPLTVNGTTTLDGNVATTGTLTNNGVDVGSPHYHGNGNGGAPTTPPIG